jgi:PPOX class probable F420-dependent enzyme
MARTDGPVRELAKLDSKAKALLGGKNFVFLATIGSDGSPQLTPTWVDTDGENVIINTAIGRIKMKNVERDPRVALSVFDHENPYHRVSIKGKVIKQVKGKKADDHIDKLAIKYTGAKFRRQEASEKRVILVIKPLSVY